MIDRLAATVERGFELQTYCDYCQQICLTQPRIIVFIAKGCLRNNVCFYSPQQRFRLTFTVGEIDLNIV